MVYDGSHKGLSSFIGDIPFIEDGDERGLKRRFPPLNALSVLKYYKETPRGLGISLARSSKFVTKEHRVVLKVFRKTRRTWRAIMRKKD